MGRFGVCRFDGKAWTAYTKTDCLADDRVYNTAVTPDEALWFGTHQGAPRYLHPL